MLKKCRVCGEEKNSLEFPPRKDSKDGLSNRCRECKRIYDNSFREKNNERQRRYRENNREKVLKYKREYNKNHYTPSQRMTLTEQEKIERLNIQKEKNRIRSREKYISNFVSKEKICKYCGTPFMTQYKKSKVFCCEECSRKHERFLSKLADKRRKGRITAIDRIDNDITLPLLFKRDKGICKICGLPCSWDDKSVIDGNVIVGNNYPSIDHIKPISKGGYHTWDNVQLAHKICNSIKSDKET